MWEPLILSQHSVKFGGHSHSASGDMFSIAEEEDSTDALALIHH